MKPYNGGSLAIDWWTNEAARKKLDEQLEKTIQEQKAATELAYKKARISGRAPNHWMSKVCKLIALSRELPKGLERLAKHSNAQSANTLLDSLNHAAKEYYKLEHSSTRAKTLRKTQEKYVQKNISNRSQATGGKISGVKRRHARQIEAVFIVEAYKTSNDHPPTVKPVARAVAKWYVNALGSTRTIRAVTQKLQRAKVAT